MCAVYIYHYYEYCAVPLVSHELKSIVSRVSRDVEHHLQHVSYAVSSYTAFKIVHLQLGCLFRL